MQVQRQNTRPRMVGVPIVALTPVRARVVDEDMEFLLAPRELLDEALTVFKFVEVGGDRVGCSRTCFSVSRIELSVMKGRGGDVPMAFSSSQAFSQPFASREEM